MGYYVRCPYYLSGQKKPTATIVCEDTHRDFGTLEKKNWQLQNICQNDWKSCRYAQELNALYERTEGMNLTRKEQEHLKHTCEAQKTEMVKLKKRMKQIAHSLDKKNRDEKAALHLAEVREKEIEKLNNNLFLEKERQRGLLALAGYIAKHTGTDEFRIDQVQMYGKRYDTVAQVEVEPNGNLHVHIVHKEKGENDDNQQQG